MIVEDLFHEGEHAQTAVQERTILIEADAIAKDGLRNRVPAGWTVARWGCDETASDDIVEFIFRDRVDLNMARLVVTSGLGAATIAYEELQRQEAGGPWSGAGEEITVTALGIGPEFRKYDAFKQIGDKFKRKNEESLRDEEQSQAIERWIARLEAFRSSAVDPPRRRSLISRIVGVVGYQLGEK